MKATAAIALVGVAAVLSACTGPTANSHPRSSSARLTASSAGTLVYVVKNASGESIGEMTPDGSGAHLLNVGGPVCCYAPAISPDGTQLVSAGEGTVEVGNADGTQSKVIWASPIDIVSSPMWSPAGDHIAFAATDTSSTPGPPESKIYVVAPDGSGLHEVTIATNAHSIAWSPDGRSLAFLQNQGQVWTVRVSGGKARSLYGRAQGEPSDSLPGTVSWAPSQTLLFDQGPPFDVWQYTPGQPAGQRLITGASGPSRAPDGLRFATVRNGHVIVTSPGSSTTATIGPAGVVSVSWGGTVVSGALAAGPLHAIGLDVTGAVFLSTTGTTASVNDSDRAGSVNQLSATINWGDATAPTPADVEVDNLDGARCTCAVSGSHSYMHEGDYMVTTTITKTARDGHVGQTVQVRSAAHVLWAVLHPMQDANVYKGVSWDGAQAIVSWAAFSGEPRGATATIDWGDGTNASTINVPAPSFLVGVTGLARGDDSVGLAASHTYASLGNDTVTLTVNAPDHAPITGRAVVAVQPVAEFSVSPQTPELDKPATFFPSPTSPNGSTVTEYDWDFGDGTAFRDTPAVEQVWRLLLASPKASSPDSAFIAAALRLGIDLTLRGQVSPAIGVLLWSGLLDHAIAHIYVAARGYRVTLTVLTALGRVSGSQDVATQKVCNVWADGAFGDYTTCDTEAGWAAATAAPGRWPDYYTFEIGGAGASKLLTAGGQVAITISSTGDVYVSYGGSVGLGLSVGSSETYSGGFGIGYVERPDGAKPSPDVITSYVDGWSINAAVTASVGHLGGSHAITWSPTSGVGGVEFYLTSANGGAALSVTTGASCSMHIGTVRSDTPLAALASLVPSPNGPWPFQDGVPVPVLSDSDIALVFSIEPSLSDLQTCGLAAPALTS